MRYAQMRKCDVANGSGIRTSLFVQGCTRHCKGCFNPETWDFAGGMEWTSQTEDEFVELTGKPHIKGATILGGEPMEPENRCAVTALLKRLKETYPEKDIWMYSSYTFEELKEDEGNVLNYLDVLVDGEFVEEKKDLSLRFRGSSNQRVIRVQDSLKEGKIVAWE